MNEFANELRSATQDADADEQAARAALAEYVELARDPFDECLS